MPSYFLKNTPIGITLPITRGNVGYFAQSTDSFTAYRNNIINLLRTKPGERRMNPTFGCNLSKLAFEPNDDFILQKVSKIIKNDISKWIPDVEVTSVEVKYFQDDQSVNLKDVNKLYIVVKFTITTIKQEDAVEIILDFGKI